MNRMSEWPRPLVACIGFGMMIAYWGGVQARKRGWVHG